jgi:transcriptional regulator with XRE-family HTH domain
MVDDKDKAFQLALAYFQREHKNQSRYAQALGISQDLLSKLLKGRRGGSDALRRKLAETLGYSGQSFESFLNVGRAIAQGREPDLTDGQAVLTPEELQERGYIAVPFSNHMRLAAGAGGTINDGWSIPVTHNADASPVAIYGPDIGRSSARNLQAFRVGGDSMEPVIAQGGVVVADLSERDPERLKEGKIYVLCWDLQDEECAVKYLRWAERGKSILITSPNQEAHAPLVRSLADIRLVGRVIWAWREFK